MARWKMQIKILVPLRGVEPHAFRPTLRIGLEDLCRVKGDSIIYRIHYATGAVKGFRGWIPPDGTVSCCGNISTQKIQKADCSTTSPICEHLAFHLGGLATRPSQWIHLKQILFSFIISSLKSNRDPNLSSVESRRTRHRNEGSGWGSVDYLFSPSYSMLYRSRKEDSTAPDDSPSDTRRISFLLTSSADLVDGAASEILGLYRRAKPGIAPRQTAAIIFDDRAIVQFSLIANHDITLISLSKRILLVTHWFTSYK